MSKEKIKLVPQMITKAAQIIEVLNPNDVNIDFVDVSRKDIPADGMLNINDLEVLAGKFLLAYDMCKDAAAVCEALSMEAKRRLENEKSLARLERCFDYFAKLPPEKSEKTLTATSKEAYVALDEQVNVAITTYNNWKALAGYFEQNVTVFELWHNLAKKMFDRDLSAMQKAQRERK